MRAVRIAMTAAVSGTLLVPTAPLADTPPAPPLAKLEAPAKAVEVGKSLKLDSSSSSAGTGAIVGHVWDLDGNGSFETDTGAKPTAELTPEKPGPLTVHVRVLDDHGLAGQAQLALTVKDPPRAAVPAPIPKITQGRIQDTAPALVPPHRLRHLAARQASVPKLRKTKPAVLVTAAAANGVKIQNFAFHPGTTTIHVGDTITWTNEDSVQHNATATDGSFGTGNINKGQSKSHTFTQAGTIPYICSIHPNMHGTVKVVAAGSSSGGTSSGGSSGGSGSGSSGSSSSGSGSGSKSSSGGSSLPMTGLNIAVVVFMAMCLAGSGASMRRALR